MYARPLLKPRIPSPRASEVKKFDSPVAGWISNRSLSSPMALGDKQGAAILDNWFPTATTAILRRGKELYATLGDGSEDVTALFSYVNGANRRLFASTAMTIYDITNVLVPYNWELGTEDGDIIGDGLGNTIGQLSTENLEVFEDALGGNWVVVQFATTGGIFLVGVNGESDGFIYDGASFYPYVEGGISIISYTTLVTPFTVGATLTGAISGATATIVSVEPGGALTLKDVTGVFQSGEGLSDSSGGSATSSSVDTVLAPGITFPGSLTTANMSYVFVFKNRLWFLEKDSLNAWYMDEIDAIGGAPVVYPLGGIVQRGGSLVWGASWSLSSGAAGGLSDQLVMTTSEGEVAVFQGTFPEDTASWLPVGVYRIGNPLGNKAFFRGGGDIAVATTVGLIPLSKAISLDVTALSPAAVSYNIQDAWQEAIDTRGSADWVCALWPERKMAVVSPPSPSGDYSPALYVSNTDTGAWCRYTNWDARAMEVFQGQLYFGGPGGKIYLANVTGNDDSETYTGIFLPLFDDMGSPSNLKVPKMGRAVARAKAKLEYTLRFKGDFDQNLGAAPTATPVAGDNSWGAGIWGQAVWGGTTASEVTQSWKSLGGTGYSCSLAYQVTSGSPVPVDAEIVRLEFTYTTGEVLS